jgi:superfamily I DNA/RNA helicase
VLAGPGTGKTTTLVESVVARVREGADPESLLVLTFSRKAAAELRERITARLGATTREPLARTVHSYAFGVLRREAAARGEPAPRLLSGTEQDVVVRELLAGGDPERWPQHVRPALGVRGFAQELRDLMLRAFERGIGPDQLAALGRSVERPEWVAAAGFMREYAEVTALRDPSAYDPAELIRAVLDLWAAEPGCSTPSAPLARPCSSTSCRTPIPHSSSCWPPSPAGAPTSSPSATPTSRSTASAAPTRRP